MQWHWPGVTVIGLALAAFAALAIWAHASIPVASAGVVAILAAGASPMRKAKED